MLVKHILLVGLLLVGYSPWYAGASKDPLTDITLKLLKSVEKTLVAVYVPKDDTCSKDYRYLSTNVMQEGVVFQSYDVDESVLVPTKHVFIIGCFEFIQNAWTKLLSVLKPTHTVAVISRNYTGTGKFLKHNSHVGLRLIVVTGREDETWVIRRIVYNPDRSPHYVHVATVPGDSIPPSKELFPVPTFYGWIIRTFVRYAPKKMVLCHGEWFKDVGGRIQFTVLFLLREYLKVCYEVEVTKFLSVGKLDKKGWTEALGVLHRNETDLVGRILVLNNQRTNYFDMSEWFDIGKVHMIGAGPIIIVKPFIVFEVFTVPLWIFIICSIIVLSYLRWMVSSLEFRVLSTVANDPVVKKRSRVYYYMQTFSMLVWRGIPETRSEERMWGLRVSTVITSLMVFILMAVYCNNITSFLAVPQVSKPINNLDDLFATTDVIPMVRPGNSHDRYIKKSDLEAMKKLKALMQANPKKAYVELYAKNISELCATGKRVYISSYSYGKYMQMRAPHLNLHVSSDHFKWDMYSFAFQKNSAYTARAAIGLQRIKQFGLIVYGMRKFHSFTAKKASVDASELVLGLRHLQGAFYIWFVGVAVSAIAFLGERIYRKIKAREPQF